MNVFPWLIPLLTLIVIALTLYAVWLTLRAPLLDPLAPNTADLPPLSVVIAARDEEERIAEAAVSLLAQDYPNLEVILIDDRSSDRTGAILDDLATNEPKLKVIHIETLPEGWLGKVYGLHVGITQARGDWILFSDADVHFAPNTLRRAVAHAQRRGLDHLALFPHMISSGFWHEAVMAAFRVFFLIGTRLHEVDDPNKPTALGEGGFNLFRRTVFDRTPGMAWLKDEVVDDVGLARMLKGAGGRNGWGFAGEAVSLVWYPSLKAMFFGLEKNLFGAVAHYSYLRLGLQITAMWGLAAAPILALFQPEGWIQGLGVAALLLTATGAAVAKVRFGMDLLPSLAAPLGQFVVGVMMLHAGYRCWRQGGVNWRGTIYPVETLKQGQRVKF